MASPAGSAAGALVVSSASAPSLGRGAGTRMGVTEREEAAVSIISTPLTLEDDAPPLSAPGVDDRLREAAPEPR